MKMLRVFTVFAFLLGLPGISSALGCPMGKVQKSCTHCPGEKVQSCPRTACVVVCPYAAEKTAELGANRPTTETCVLAVNSSPAPSVSAPADGELEQFSTTNGAVHGPLYILNRVLLL